MKRTMMAANLHAPGDLRYEEVPMPVCAEDEVLLQIHYCGICGSDIPRVLTKGTYHFPTIPGHEFSGVVVYDPQGKLNGTHATVFPMLPCGTCAMCREKVYELCENYDYYGSRRDGGFAEYLAVKRWNIVPLPQEIPLLDGSLCEPLAVAHHAAARLLVAKGDHVLISGAGPIGLLVGRWLRAMGAETVYFFDILPEKIDYARKLGFSEYDGSLVDSALEGTGFSDALGKCLKAVKPQGRLVLMGNPSREVTLSQDIYWQILRKELTVTGTWNSSYRSDRDDWAASVEALRTGTVQSAPVISHVFPLHQVEEAFKVLKDRSQFKNRIVLKTVMEEEL